MDRRLHDEDFYLWTQEQAEALRREGGRAGGSNAIDWELVAEEVGDLGISERNRAFSLIRQILAHFYKLAWTLREEPKAHWRSEVRAFRQDLRDTMTSAIREKAEQALEGLHAQAVERIEEAFAAEEPAAPRDASLRWTLAQVLSEADDPIR
jgi:hypothetical protein